MTEPHTMGMRDAVLLTIEGASSIMSFWKSKENMKSGTLYKIQKLRAECEDIMENDLSGTPDENPSLHKFVSTIEKMQLEVFGEARDIDFPYATKAVEERSFFGKSHTTESMNENIRRQVALRELKIFIQQEIARLELPIKEEVEQLRETLRERESNVRKGQDMFYGSLETDSTSSVNIQAASTCEVVVDLVKSADPSGGLAGIALANIFHYLKETETSEEPSKEAVALWSNVRDWEDFDPSPSTKALLEGSWNNFTEIDILSKKAAAINEDSLEAIETLRQLLCIDPNSIPYSLRSHLRRVVVKEHNRKVQAHNNDLQDAIDGKKPFTPELNLGEWPILTETGEWQEIKNVRMLRMMLHVLRNAIVPFLTAKKTLEVHDASPLHLFRRQAIVDIGEMASHGNQIAADYLFDDLCGSKDWSIRQIALARAARILPKANYKDQGDITMKLLSAATAETEYGVVRETAETAMIQALKGGLNRKPDYVELFNKISNTLRAGIPSSSPCMQAWNRIQAQGFEGTVQPRSKKVVSSKSGMRSLRAGYSELENAFA